MSNGVIESEFSADHILTKYSNSRNVILEKLKKYKTFNLWDYLNSDRGCKVNLGYYDSHLTLKSKITCRKCEEISYLTDLIETPVEKPFSIGSGKYKDTLLVIDINNNVIPKNKYSPHIKANLEYLFKYFTSFKMCDSSLDLNTEWLALDVFSNKVLINIIIQSLIPVYIPKLHTAFICGSDGYSLTEEPEIGYIENLFEFPEYFNDKNLKPEVVKDILVQICEILTALKSSNFCHNDATINSLVFTLKDDKLITQITNLDYSAINYGNLRIYNQNQYSSLFVKDEPFIPDIKIVDMGEVCSNDSSYRFNTESGKQIINLRRLGVPIYNTSFDLYTFLISLCTQSVFYNTLTTDPKLAKIWKSIWKPQDLKIITYRIQQAQAELNMDFSIEKIVEILSSLTLKCDFLQFLDDTLKS